MRGGLLGGRSVFLSITHSITYFLQNHRGSILAECSSGGSEAFPMFVWECGYTHSRLCARGAFSFGHVGDGLVLGAAVLLWRRFWLLQAKGGFWLAFRWRAGVVRSGAG